MQELFFYIFIVYLMLDIFLFIYKYFRPNKKRLIGEATRYAVNTMTRRNGVDLICDHCDEYAVFTQVWYEVNFTLETISSTLEKKCEMHEK